MVNLLDPIQLQARARLRRELLSTQTTDDGLTQWPIIIEGWSGQRQVFGFGVTTSDEIAMSILLARSALDVDTVVVFSDSRLFSPDLSSPAESEMLARYERGEVTLMSLAQQGHPGISEQIVILPADTTRGAYSPQMLGYLGKYSFGREVGLVWDPEPSTVLLDQGPDLSGKIPEGLAWALRDNGFSADGQIVPTADGGVLLWERLDKDILDFVASALDQVSEGRFVILNAASKITTAAGLTPGSAPGRIAIGNRDPHVVAQLVAREVA